MLLMCMNNIYGQPRCEFYAISLGLLGMDSSSSSPSVHSSSTPAAVFCATAATTLELTTPYDVEPSPSITDASTGKEAAIAAWRFTKANCFVACGKRKCEESEKFQRENSSFERSG